MKLNKQAVILLACTLLFSITACTKKQTTPSPVPPAQTNEELVKETLESAKKGSIVDYGDLHIGDAVPRDWSKLDPSKKRYADVKEMTKSFQGTYVSPKEDAVAFVNNSKIKLLMSLSEKYSNRFTVDLVKKVLGTPKAEKKMDQDTTTLRYEADKNSAVYTISPNVASVSVEVPPVEKAPAKTQKKIGKEMVFVNNLKEPVEVKIHLADHGPSQNWSMSFQVQPGGKYTVSSVPQWAKDGYDSDVCASLHSIEFVKLDSEESADVTGGKVKLVKTYKIGDYFPKKK